MRHPNATAAGVTGLATVAVIYLASYFFGVDLTPEVAGTIVTALTIVVLYIGRRGLRGVYRDIVYGRQED